MALEMMVVTLGILSHVNADFTKLPDPILCSETIAVILWPSR